MPNIPPQTRLIIEDSRTGVTAARAAGMKVIYLNAAGEV
jgi:beta-phosphoglucomutase-like phosphatase (HAD superfamily)